MRRIILGIVCLLSGVISCFAGVVTPDRASAMAEAFFKANPATKSVASPVRLAAMYPDVQTKSGETAPGLYVYERESGGFVLIAGDDALRPVLGFSDTGSFPSVDRLPVNLKDVLDFYVTVQELARTRGWIASEDIRGQWERPVTAAPTSTSVQLTTARWNQWRPFNDLCPKVDGQECPCGCVATAMAIIMYYHKWPEKGTGTLPSYGFRWDDYYGGYRYQVDAVQLGHTYDWGKMMSDYNGNYSQESGYQVAVLLRDLGVMSEMDYDPSGSGASGTSPILLAKYFGYDKQMRYFDREDFRAARWEEMIRDELDAGRPVFHCGFSSRGGHAFVMDGYRDRYFSINYGWGGGSGFYTITPIDGYESDLTEFSKWQDMVTHIMPDQGGAPYVSYYVGSDFAPFGWDFRSDTFRTGSSRLWAYSRSTADGDTELCYCLYDADEHFKEALSDPFTVTSGSWPVIVPSVVCRAPSALADGDCIMLSRRDERYQWVPLPQQRYQYLMPDSTRKLSEMVSVGRSEGYATRWQHGYSPFLVFRAYKDIYWEIRSKDGEVLLTSAADGEYYDEHIFYFNEVLTNESKKDRAYFEFQLPSGEYSLFFRNYEEEMTIKVIL